MRADLEHYHMQRTAVLAVQPDFHIGSFTAHVFGWAPQHEYLLHREQIDLIVEWENGDDVL